MTPTSRRQGPPVPHSRTEPVGPAGSERLDLSVKRGIGMAWRSNTEDQPLIYVNARHCQAEPSGRPPAPADWPEPASHRFTPQAPPRAIRQRQPPPEALARRQCPRCIAFLSQHQSPSQPELYARTRSLHNASEPRCAATQGAQAHAPWAFVSWARAEPPRNARCHPSIREAQARTCGATSTCRGGNWPAVVPE